MILLGIEFYILIAFLNAWMMANYYRKHPDNPTVVSISEQMDESKIVFFFLLVTFCMLWPWWLLKYTYFRLFVHKENNNDG